MPVDPMTSFEQAEVEAEERQDEMRRELHYAQAEKIAGELIERFWERNHNSISRHCPKWELDIEATRWLLKVIDYQQAKEMQDFAESYGTPALLSVIGKALD